MRFFLMSPDSEGYLLADVINDIMIAVNLVFSTSQAFICCSFTDSISWLYLLRRNIVAAIRGAADPLPTPASHRRRPNEGRKFFSNGGNQARSGSRPAQMQICGKVARSPAYPPPRELPALKDQSSPVGRTR